MHPQIVLKYRDSDDHPLDLKVLSSQATERSMIPGGNYERL